jgi:hypothetical protein
MHSALSLAFCATFLLPVAQAIAAEAQRPEQVQSDISTREISIQSNFTGIEIVLFGAVDFSRAPSPDEALRCHHDHPRPEPADRGEEEGAHRRAVDERTVEDLLLGAGVLCRARLAAVPGDRT